MQQAIKLVVFDIAGTTVKDSGSVTNAMMQALENYGYSVPDAEIDLLMGYKKPQAIERLLKEYERDPDKISPYLVERIHNSFLEIMTAYYTSTNELAPAKGAEDVFASLKEMDIKVALNTGFSRMITDVILNRLGWLKNKQVDYVISSDEVISGRPSPYMIQSIMQQAGIGDARMVVKVGDTEVDINEGKNAGCLYSIGITSGAFTRKQLEAYDPSFIIDELNELLPIISQN